MVGQDWRLRYLETESLQEPKQSVPVVPRSRGRYRKYATSTPCIVDEGHGKQRADIFSHKPIPDNGL